MNGSGENRSLPEGWAATIMGDVAQVVGGGTPKTTIAGNFRDEGGHPWLTPADLTGYREKHVSRGRRDLTDQGLAGSSAKYMPAGTILFSTRAPIGYVAIATNPITTNQGFRSFVPSEALDSDYAYHYLKSITALAEQLAGGTTFDELSGSKAKTLPLVLPPLAEQQRIAARLDAIESRHAASAAHLHSARVLVARLRNAVLVAACSGRLTADWREAHPDATAVQITRADRDALPLFDSPDSWRWSGLESVAEIRGGIQVGARRKGAKSLREVPYLRVANVQRGWLDLSEVKTIAAPEDKIAALRLKPGDIFFNEGGDRDKLGRGWVWEGQIGECIHQNHVFRARLRDTGFEPRFYSWFGNSFGTRYFLAEGKQTVNLASLSKTRLGRLPVPIPPISEQREIVRRIDTMLATADRLVGEIDRAAATLKRVSKASLAKAFRGELVPLEAVLARDEGRDFEAAEELLARVDRAR